MGTGSQPQPTRRAPPEIDPRPTAAPAPYGAAVVRSREHGPVVLGPRGTRYEQGCAFEELISLHGGLGGPQTRPFILHPVALAMRSEPVVGAAAVHDLLAGWGRSLQGEPRDS